MNTAPPPIPYTSASEIEERTFSIETSLIGLLDKLDKAKEEERRDIAARYLAILNANLKDDISKTDPQNPETVGAFLDLVAAYNTTVNATKSTLESKYRVDCSCLLLSNISDPHLPLDRHRETEYYGLWHFTQHIKKKNTLEGLTALQTKIKEMVTEDADVLPDFLATLTYVSKLDIDEPPVRIDI